MSNYLEVFNGPIHYPLQDYFEIIKKPMDLSLIKRKLDTGQYADPWQYVDDVWLMFDNAWLYNKKSSKVHKNCSKVRTVDFVYLSHHTVDYNSYHETVRCINDT